MHDPFLRAATIMFCDASLRSRTSRWARREARKALTREAGRHTRWMLPTYPPDADTLRGIARHVRVPRSLRRLLAKSETPQAEA
jgi:hypothetical protein